MKLIRRMGKRGTIIVAMLLVATVAVILYPLSIATGYDLNVSITKIVVESATGKVKEFTDVHGVAWSYSDGKASPFQDLSVSMTIPKNFKFTKTVDLTQPNGTKVRVYVYSGEIEVGIKAVKADIDYYGIAYLYDEDDTVTVYFTFESRISNLAVLAAYAYNVTEIATPPHVLKNRLGWLIVDTIRDGEAQSTPVAPLSAGDLPNTLNKPYPNKVEDALQALSLPITFWVKAKVATTIIRDITGKFAQASATIIFRLRIELVTFEKIDIANPERTEKMDDIDVKPPPDMVVTYLEKIKWILVAVGAILFLIIVIKIMSYFRRPPEATLVIKTA